MTAESYDYPGAFQRKLLAALIRKPEKMRDLIEPDYFSNPVHQDLARLAKRIRESPETKNVKLSKPTLIAMTKAFLGKRKNDLWGMYRRTISKVFKTRLKDFPVLWKEAAEFAKQARFREAIVLAERDIGNRKYESVIRRINELKGIGAESDLGLDYWHKYDSDDRWTEDRTGIIPTIYLPLLDKAMGGGVGKGELAIAEGGGKVGKSTFLGQIAAGGMWNGSNIAIASGELSAFKYRKRIDARLSGIGYYDLYNKRDKNAGTKAQLAWIRSQVRGHMRIKAFPSGRSKIQDIEAWLLRLEDTGFKTDLLIVDYLALFRPNESHGDKRLDLGQAAVDLRGLAMEKQLAVWTAAQVNRAGLNKPMIGPADLAEDISLFFTLDFLVAICQTDEERGTPEERIEGKPERGRIILASARDVARGAIINLSIKRSIFAMKETGYWEGEKENPSGKKTRDRKLL